MERSIAVGDWIRVEPHEGRVKEIRWRQTSIETRNWDTVVIPNSVLMRSQVILLGHRESMPRQRRQWVYFNVDFRYPPTRVIEAVETALAPSRSLNAASVPPPNCVLMDFKESYASYAVRYWRRISRSTIDELVVRSRVYFALRRIGIPLSIPAQSLFVTKDEPERRERKHSERLPGGFARWRRRVVPLAHRGRAQVARGATERGSVRARGGDRPAGSRSASPLHHGQRRGDGPSRDRRGDVSEESERFTKATFSARWA